MTNTTKKKVTAIVTQYKKMFQTEYDIAVAGNKKRAKNQRTNWGEVTDAQELGREVLRWPETLDIAFKLKLSNDEWEDLMSDKGIVWFQRSFPEFVPNNKTE